ncbi:MAG: N-acetyl-gamma-glutamyl-phosphate reductase [Akkermansiaceae bacterium]|nr:N-acetyl-gamma-glutamyl-phosphate reductase [Akkermansiaceae bacterium]
MKRVKVAVAGASGYTGQELLRILLRHRGAELVCATSRQYAGRRLGEVFPRFRQVPGAELPFTDSDVRAIAATGAEAAFLALPHGVSSSYARGLVDAGVKVIDLSADFRLNDPAVYEEYYGKAHPDPDLLKEAVYGMPEWRSGEIRTARIIASPGCYPTSILLPLIPLLRAGLLRTKGIVVNSASGVTGAGRKADISLLFCECNESMRAYGIPKHRHLSEIEQELGAAAGEAVRISFTPHLVPLNSGICTTISAELREGADPALVGRALEEAYARAPFVRLLGRNACPDTKNVSRTNFVDIGWAWDERTGRVLLLSAEDNVVKGAGGQGVHAFNVLFGFDETEGLWIL